MSNYLECLRVSGINPDELINIQYFAQDGIVRQATNSTIVLYGNGVLMVKVPTQEDPTKNAVVRIHLEDILIVWAGITDSGLTGIESKDDSNIIQLVGRGETKG